MSVSPVSTLLGTGGVPSITGGAATALGGTTGNTYFGTPSFNKDKGFNIVYIGILGLGAFAAWRVLK